MNVYALRPGKPLSGRFQRRELKESLMTNPRKYGTAPYAVAVVHGGPGAPGDAAPMAKHLSSLCGVLEPLQSETTIAGQIKELHALLKDNGKFPMILAGYSWGAILSFLFASEFPALVQKLLLIACPPFEDCYVPTIMETRLNRLDIKGRKQLYRLIEAFNEAEGNDKDVALSKLGAFFERVDSFDPLPCDANDEALGCQAETFQSILGEFKELREGGALLESAKRIQCPVVAIHGDFDPHPAEGVQNSLTPLIKNFHLIQLSHCGHTPWRERQSRERFFEVLLESLAKTDLT